MSAVRTGRVLTSLVVGLVVGGLLWGMGLPMGAAQPDPSLTGPALAEELGLELHDEFFSGCHHYVTKEVDGSSAGWCVDEVVSSDEEAWELTHRLIGMPPSDLDRQIFTLEMEFRALEDRSGEEAREIVQKLNELLASEEATEN